MSWELGPASSCWEKCPANVLFSHFIHALLTLEEKTQAAVATDRANSAAAKLRHYFSARHLQKGASECVVDFITVFFRRHLKSLCLTQLLSLAHWGRLPCWLNSTCLASFLFGLFSCFHLPIFTNRFLMEQIQKEKRNNIFVIEELQCGRCAVFIYCEIVTATVSLLPESTYFSVTRGNVTNTPVNSSTSTFVASYLILYMYYILKHILYIETGLFQILWFQ